MKLLAKVNDDKFIAEVSKDKIRKYLDRYYKVGRSGSFELTVDKEIDLGKGHDFAMLAKRALNTMTELVRHNKDVLDFIASEYERMVEIDKEE